MLNCIRNVLQISSINTHLLLDAYHIEFGLEIDEKIVPIRQNPLFKFTGTPVDVRYRFGAFEGFDCDVLWTIKEEYAKMEGKINGITKGK